jgi:N-acetylglutamate synthase-like GNAT family acetyltransferase
MKKVDIKIQQLKDNYPFDLLLLADESIEAIKKYINACIVFEILLNNKMIGIMAVMINNDNTIELKNIAISKNHQRNGFGKQAINLLEKFYKEKGVRIIYVGTGDASLGQQNFYQDLGFEKDSIKEDFFLNNYPSAIFENGIQLKDMVMFKKQI